MSRTALRWLFWTPRILTVVFTLFISLFALDVFGHGTGFWQTLLALAMHLIPSFILAGMLLLAWRWEWIGALVSAGLAGLFLWWNYTVRHNVLTAVLIIAGPLVVMCALFLWNWILHDQVRAARSGGNASPLSRTT